MLWGCFAVSGTGEMNLCQRNLKFRELRRCSRELCPTCFCGEKGKNEFKMASSDSRS